MIFDQYSRYAALVTLLRHIGSHGAKILDVGSGPECLLGAMIDEACVTYIDPLISSQNDQWHVTGDVHSPLLLQRSFEIACAVDVLEHVQPDCREDFLKQLSSLATKALVIGFPMSDSPHSNEVDAFVNNAYKQTYGIDYPWLAEHFTNGLPSVASTCDHLKQLGWHCQTIGHGYAPWLKKLLSEVVCYWDIPELQPLVLDASSAFNSDLADNDFLPPHYRTFVLASRSPLPQYVVKGISQAKQRKLMNRFLEISDSMRSKYAFSSLALLKSQQNEILGINARLREVSNWGLNASADVANRDALVITQNARNLELASWATKLSADVADRDARIAELHRKIEETSTWGNKASSEVAQRDALIAELNRKLEGMALWGAKLASDVSERDDRIEQLTRKVDEMSAWGSRLSSSVAERETRIAELQRTIEETSSWGNKASSEVAQRDALIAELNHKVEEMSSWGTKASRDVEKRDTRIAELNRKVEELASWGTTLASTMVERDSLIATLNLKIDEVSTWGSKLSAALTERDDLIAELRRQIEGASHGKSGMESS